VEAVGIEEQSIHPVSPIPQGFSWTHGVRWSAQEHEESGLSDNLGTHVPRHGTGAELLAKIRTAVDAGIISDDYAQTLTDLVDILAEESR